MAVRIHWQRIICRLISNVNSNQQQLVTALNWLFVTGKKKKITVIIIDVIFRRRADSTKKNATYCNCKNNLAWLLSPSSSGHGHRKTAHTIQRDKNIGAYIMQIFIVATVYNGSVHLCARRNSEEWRQDNTSVSNSNSVLFPSERIKCTKALL